MNKKVSVVLPVYFVNRRWLERSIISVLAQDYEPIELIVVNDGATDHIDDLIGSFGIEKYVKNHGNRGLPYSLNRGFELAEGQYHTWTSADNFMLSGMIARLINELEKRKDLSIVCGRSKYINERDVYVMPALEGEVIASKLAGCGLTDGYIERKYTYYGSLGACFLYKSEVYKELEGYNECLHGSEDYDFWIRASRSFKMGRISWEERPLYVYRVHSKSISSMVSYCYTMARLRILKREYKLNPEDKDLRKAIRHYRILTYEEWKKRAIAYPISKLKYKLASKLKIPEMSSK